MGRRQEELVGESGGAGGRGLANARDFLEAINHGTPIKTEKGRHPRDVVRGARGIWCA